MTPEIAELLAALKSVTDDMDQAGGDNYGMPECPWCHIEFRYDRDDEHSGNCELRLAREVIAKYVTLAPASALVAPRKEKETKDE